MAASAEFRGLARIFLASLDLWRSKSLQSDDLKFDLKAVRVWRGEEELTLTDKELAILELLMREPGNLFSQERILSKVWRMYTDPLTNVVDVYVAKLRKKIDFDRTRPLIETVRGRGYRLSRPDDSV